MTEYQFLLDDGRGADLMTETVEAGDDAEAELLGRMRLSAAPSLQRIIIMRRAFEVAVLQRPQQRSTGPSRTLFDAPGERNRLSPCTSGVGVPDHPVQQPLLRWEATWSITHGT